MQVVGRHDFEIERPPEIAEAHAKMTSHTPLTHANMMSIDFDATTARSPATSEQTDPQGILPPTLHRGVFPGERIFS
jgi:hypothetical protein